MIPVIKIEDYCYDLPDERIAKYPLPERDSSKLLRYKDGKVDEFVFRSLPDLLPEGSLMVFNDTKVVPARLRFRRESGANIEIFCLEPVDPPEYNTAFASTSSCVWKCVIGNAKRWKGDILTLYNPDNSPEVAELDPRARLVGRDDRTGEVEFTWEGGHPFSNVLDICGSVPIPPYLNRGTEDIDIERYQTLYARVRGSVAAPTAGLHFTGRVLEGIRSRRIGVGNVCLHVGAGTFLPVKSAEISGHPMHREPFSVSLDLLRRIRDNAGSLIAVGTTSVRTLESLYYVGVSCIEKGVPEDVGQWVPYQRDHPYSVGESIDAIIRYLEKENLDEVKVGTRIIIVPGFKFRLVDVLVTNFHQPESTLILLISAFVGGDWRVIYDYALANGFRFLSYGDSSVLFRGDAIANSCEIA
ncbi:MAG: S-adenosylmethionine:tRNA ribosyltransferase-isomerase [Bacteroidales bacterium]|nr:S-adenosylmethionine:tRNA ribosyltransferase-isomerase [Bacteroidales bacterium]